MSTPTLENIMAQLLQRVADGTDFVIAQLPSVVQQLILYKTVSYAFWALVGITLIAVSVHTRRKIRLVDEFVQMNADERSALSKAKRERLHRLALADFETWGWAIVIVSCLAGTLFLCFNFLLLLKITLAPKIWLLEYAASLLRSTT